MLLMMQSFMTLFSHSTLLYSFIRFERGRVASFRGKQKSLYKIYLMWPNSQSAHITMKKNDAEMSDINKLKHLWHFFLWYYEWLFWKNIPNACECENGNEQKNSNNREILRDKKQIINTNSVKNIQWSWIPNKFSRARFRWFIRAQNL